MPNTNDMELLRDYGQHGTEAAFAELVQRHVPLVYSAALRHVEIPTQAEEITQAVFIILARKAAGLRQGTILEGWLYETTRLTALSFLRGERRRQFREQEAYMQSTLNERAGDSGWDELSPLLDEAMARLGSKDRDAVILRYFKEKSVREVASAMQVNEAAAQRRILRALEKLRRFFTKRGVASTTAIVAGAISANSIQAAPATLATSVTTVAVAKGAVASTSTLTLIKGALKIMAWTKAKTAIVAGAGILLLAGTTAVTVKQIAVHKADETWRAKPYFDSRTIELASPQVTILPSKYSRFGGFGGEPNGKIMGLGAPVNYLAEAAWDYGAHRLVFSTAIPKGRYDFIASLPSGNSEALKQAIKKKFGLVGRIETVETNVLFLQLVSQNAPGLVRNTSFAGGMSSGNRTFQCEAQPISTLAGSLESIFGVPVIDQTGLKDTYDINLKWRNLDDLKQILVTQLGLELVSGQGPVQMLIVDKE